MTNKVQAICTVIHQLIQQLLINANVKSPGHTHHYLLFFLSRYGAASMTFIQYLSCSHTNPLDESVKLTDLYFEDNIGALLGADSVGEASNFDIVSDITGGTFTFHVRSLSSSIG